MLAGPMLYVVPETPQSEFNEHYPALPIYSSQSRKHLRIESQVVLTRAPLSTRSNASLIPKNNLATQRGIIPQSQSSKQINYETSQRSEAIRRILKQQ
jgi:hypothetical protein